MRTAVLALFATLAAVHSSHAVERWMTEDEMRAAFGGKTLDGHYQGGRTFTETYRADGSLRYRDELRASNGHWSVTAGTFCTIYDEDSTGGCFRVHREGANCYEFYFVARTEEKAKEPGTPSWTARAWHTGEKSTCVDGANA